MTDWPVGINTSGKHDPRTSRNSKQRLNKDKSRRIHFKEKKMNKLISITVLLAISLVGVMAQDANTGNVGLVADVGQSPGGMVGDLGASPVGQQSLTEQINWRMAQCRNQIAAIKRSPRNQRVK